MTTPGNAPGGQAPAPKGGQAPAPAQPWPFPVGVFDEEILNSYDQTVTATTATVQFPDVQIEPDGWSRGWWFDFLVVATNSNTNTVKPGVQCTVEGLRRRDNSPVFGFH